MKKCPNGMLAEVKYDGERVQVHKKGNEFRYFSRSLKPVLPHKVNIPLRVSLDFLIRKMYTCLFSFQVNLFKNYIPKAFPDGDDLILDSEILMIDTKTGQPLPFGTLGIHKVRLFVENLLENLILKILSVVSFSRKPNSRMPMPAYLSSIVSIITELFCCISKSNEFNSFPFGLK